jgi:hypothetical protein
MMQVDGFGAETNEPNTKFKWGGSTQIPWYIKWALETLQWKYGTIPKFMRWKRKAALRI